MKAEFVDFFGAHYLCSKRSWRGEGGSYLCCTDMPHWNGHGTQIRDKFFKIHM